MSYGRLLQFKMRCVAAYLFFGSSAGESEEHLPGAEEDMSRHKHRGLISEINVVPYVDVMLVLLVVFMITAPLLSQGIVIDLPEVPADPLNAASDDPLILSVDREGRFYLNFGGDAESPVDEQTVLDRAAVVMRRDADAPILVRGDEGATHGRVMHGFALLKQAGVRQAILVTDAPVQEQ